MSVPIAKTQHPFNLFCMNLFHAGPVPASVEAEKRITLDDLAAMSKETQMLLAHSLERGNPNLTLLHGDTDAGEMLSASWLVSLPSRARMEICYRIKPAIWRRLRSLSSTFLNHAIRCELKSYRKRKSAEYPWVW